MELNHSRVLLTKTLDFSKFNFWKLILPEENYYNHRLNLGPRGEKIFSQKKVSSFMVQNSLNIERTIDENIIMPTGNKVYCNLFFTK